MTMSARGLAAAAVVVLALFAPRVVAQQPPSPTYIFLADGLACPFCSYGIEKQVARIAGVEKIEIDVVAGSVTVTMAAGTTLDETDAERAVKAAGFSFRDFRRVGR